LFIQVLVTLESEERF